MNQKFSLNKLSQAVSQVFTSSSKEHSRAQRAPLFEALEPRFLLSSDGLIPPPPPESTVTLTSALQANLTVTPSQNLIAQSVPAALTAASLDYMSDDLNSVQVQAANSSDTITTSQNLSGPSRLVIVDPEVEDYQSLISLLDSQLGSTENSDASKDVWNLASTTFTLSGVDSEQPLELQSGRIGDTQVILLDSKLDGVSQISSILTNFQGLESVEILSHGSTGSLRLGSGDLNLSTLESRSAEIEAWGHGLADGGDILLYGCDVASGSTGVEFVQALATATNSDVAASTNKTGAASQQGDWTLEYSTGVIQTQSVFTSVSAASYAYLLDPFVSTPASESFSGTVEDDTFTFSNGFGQDTVTDSSVDDIDTLDFSSVTTNLLYTFSKNATDELVVSVSDGTNTVSATNIENLIGGQGSNTIIGSDEDTTWSITGLNEGSYAGLVTFEGIQNLSAGDGLDIFNIDDDAKITGLLDGGGGLNAIDLSDYSTSVTVNLIDLTATGSLNFANIDDFTGGSALNDNFYGPAVDAVWRITDVDTGQINNEIDFVGFENLYGADATSDGFVFEGDSSLTGLLSGGSGAGKDTLVVQQGVDENLNVVNVASDAQATLTFSGKTITYVGIEPVVTLSGNVYSVNGTSVDDRYELSGDGVDTLTLTSTATAFYDVASDSLLSSLTISNISATSQINFELGAGNDSLTLGDTLIPGLSLSVAGG
ncbi:MAG: hypothetical protein ACI97H_001362, partial [Marinobacter psychrophilus]